MSEPPQMRLVPRSRYLLLLTRWLLSFQLAWICSILGGGLVLLELFYLGLQVAIFFHAPIEVEKTPFEGPLALLIVPLGVVSALAGQKLFARTGTEVPFAPITPENTHLLPAVESLVRSSDLPQQSQQAELLRATPDSPETPQDQLLRVSSSPGNELSR
ncbi:MAG: hypothetical protein JWN14_3373 [Chthonomonadales bacterium]|nr:hypothetical protein [Chthonomonadales bacterium]